ncbi:MAG: hypothetical protein VST67_08390 [Nitrospirota bacterium]|nr:hypothetical protein [Nitrospirota bacterium]
MIAIYHYRNRESTVAWSSFGRKQTFIPGLSKCFRQNPIIEDTSPCLPLPPPFARRRSGYAQPPLLRYWFEELKHLASTGE